MHQFEEKHPEFHGFSDYYNQTLRPGLEEKEAIRQTAQSRFYKVLIAVGLAEIILFITLYVKQMPLHFMVFGLIAGLIFILLINAILFNKLRAQTKNYLVKNICDFLNWDFMEKEFSEPDLEPFTHHGLLPRSYNRVSFEDQMTGQVRGADFYTVECHMERREQSKNKSEWETVFRGSVMILDFHREFSGKTIVLRDQGWFNANKRSGMKRVGLVDPVFEKIFEVYSTDQVESRYILTPDFMQTLVDLEQRLKGSGARFGFLDNRLFITLKTSNKFESGSMLKPMTETQRIQDLLDEFGAIYDLVASMAKPKRR